MNNALVIAKKYIDYLRKNGVFVETAYLFGSYAKGTFKDWSDIDVGVISPNFGNNYFDELIQLRKMASVIDNRLEPVPLNGKDLNDKYSTLSTEIRTYGIKITP